MTTTKAGAHTQGRLVAYGLVLRGDPDGPTDESQVAGATTAADGRRLAACWNACEGIDTDNLEKFPGWASDGFAPGVKVMQELAAARALLAECLVDVPATYVDPLIERIRAFLKGQK